MVSDSKIEWQKRFGLRVRELREKRQLTKTAVADLMGKEVQDVQKIEVGKRNPTLHTIILLAKALEVPPSELFKFDVS